MESVSEASILEQYLHGQNILMLIKLQMLKESRIQVILVCVLTPYCLSSEVWVTMNVVHGWYVILFLSFFFLYTTL